MFRDAHYALLLIVLAAACGGRARRAARGPAAAAGASGDDGVLGAAGSEAAGGTSGIRYSTDFDAAESPLSEDGAWHHEGAYWTAVESGDGTAFGTQPLGDDRVANEVYNDSYAYLSGFPADQQASAIIHLGAVDASCTHEVELLLRWADSPDSARGYECNLAYDGSYAQIVRWDGPLGAFQFLATGSVPEGISDGDTFSASVLGDRIELSVNGVVRASASDATFTSGDPGIGFWRGTTGCGAFGDFAFTSFTASSLPE